MKNRFFILILLAFAGLLSAAPKLIEIDYYQLAYGQEYTVLGSVGAKLLVKADEPALEQLKKRNSKFTVLDELYSANNNYLIFSQRDHNRFDKSAVKSLGQVLSEYENTVLIKSSSKKYNNFSADYQVMPLSVTGRKMVRDDNSYQPKRPMVADPFIKSLTEQISADSLGSYIQHLQNYGSRYAFHPNRRSIALWLQEKYRSFGCPVVEIDSFYLRYSGYYTDFPADSGWQYNVIATIPGSTAADQIILLGGHSDSHCHYDHPPQPMVTAPGADDNASGTVATMEICRVLLKNNYRPKSTMKFVAFAAEEIMGSGNSGAYDLARKLKAAGKTIKMMYNNDMIANLKNANGVANWKVQNRRAPGEYASAQFADSICAAYTNMQIETMNENTSDSYPFWQQGFHTQYFMESSMSPNYHRSTDLLTNLDMSYCREVSKISLASACEIDRMPDFRITNFKLYLHNQETVIADWDKISAPDFSKYRIAVYKNGAMGEIKIRDVYTTDSHIGFDSLVSLGSFPTLAITVSAISAEGFESFGSRYTLDFNTVIPKTYVNTEFKNDNQLVFQWQVHQNLNFNKYKLMRKEHNAEIFQTVFQTADRHSNKYTDEMPQEDKLYEYLYCLELKDGSLYMSDTIRVLGNDTVKKKLLIVYSDNNYYYPNQSTPFDTSQLHGYMKNLATKLSANTYYQQISSTSANYQGIYCQTMAGQYRNILFCSPNSARDFLPNNSNMIFSSNDPYPFIFDGHITKVNNYEVGNSLSRFSGAKPCAAGFDSVYTDSTKLSATINYHLKKIGAIYSNNANTSVIYKSDTEFDSTTSAGAYYNKPVGIMYNGDDFKSVSLAFPLYFMQPSQTERMINHILELFGSKEPETADNSTSQLELSNWPNPFNQTTQIRYKLPANGDVKLALYNIRGELVVNLVNSQQKAGIYNLNLDGATLASGVYFPVISFNGQIKSSKILLVK